ncbi:MAG TPA: MBL fold metallo-hydrolase [Actinomycetota bacterium]|nr:MBL fold metallo-hydrolase [Actinomycetota bacterium]
MRVAERWFERETVGEGVVRIVEPHVDPFLRANLYLVRGRDRDVLIDAGLGLRSLVDELADLFERPVLAIATHRHFDHVGGLREFDAVAVHRDDAEAVATGGIFASLVIEDYPPEELSGYDPPGSLLTALPHEGFDPATYRVEPVTPAVLLDEGDVIDLGERKLEVLHLPGHTPGEIGLWEDETGTLFPGDCVYESGVLLDELPESDIPRYVQSMERLRDLPVSIVHGGHDDSFGRDRLLELIDEYVQRRSR